MLFTKIHFLQKFQKRKTMSSYVYDRDRLVKSRNWVFTINNPEGDDGKLAVPGSLFLFYQREVGNENTTEHYQGLVCFANARGLSGVKKLLPRAHLEVMKGTVDQSIDYCSKEEGRISGPFEEGEKPVGQGKRTDIKQVFDMVKNGDSELAIADAAPQSWIRYYRGIERYRRLTTSARNFQTEVRVYYGPPGSGKSRRALSEAGTDSYWLVRPRTTGGGVWWDGYSGQPTVVIDEFYGWLTRDFLQRLVDRYPLMIETKGGALSFTSKLIIITSNLHPKQWYKKVGLGALKRRLLPPIGKVVYMGDNKFPTPESYFHNFGDLVGTEIWQL